MFLLVFLVKRISDGNDVLRMGEKGLFEDISKNIKTFNASQVKIVTLSHIHNTFKNDYPAAEEENTKFSTTLSF